MYVTYNNLFKLLIDKGLNKTEFAREVNRNPYDIVTVPIDPPLYRHLAICYKDWDLLPLASKHFITYIKEKPYFFFHIFYNT